MAISLADFTLLRAVCELRYSDAYLLFDTTGQIYIDVRDRFTNLTVTSAAPNSTTFHCDEGTFTVELGAFRFSAERPDSSLEIFAKRVQTLFSAVTERLKIDAFNRIGLRIIHQKQFKELKEAIAVLNQLDLLKSKEQRFGTSNNMTSIELRWEDEQIGATTKIFGSTAEIKAQLPAELGEKESIFNRKIHSLTVDVDYYTKAVVEKSQWDANAWIPQSVRIVKKESNRLLEA